MAQYDVNVNPPRQSRQFVPLVVDVQSALIDRLATRLVLPLSCAGSVVSHLPINLCPTVDIEGEKLTIQAHLAAPVAASLLKNPVTNLQSWSSEITFAIGSVISSV